MGIVVSGRESRLERKRETDNQLSLHFKRYGIIAFWLSLFLFLYILCECVSLPQSLGSSHAKYKSIAWYIAGHKQGRVNIEKKRGMRLLYIRGLSHGFHPDNNNKTQQQQQQHNIQYLYNSIDDICINIYIRRRRSPFAFRWIKGQM